jgi:hypothetical protein
VIAGSSLHAFHATVLVVSVSLTLIVVPLGCISICDTFYHKAAEINQISEEAIASKG